MSKKLLQNPAGFERLVWSPALSGCIDNAFGIACFAVLARNQTARSRAGRGGFATASRGPLIGLLAVLAIGLTGCPPPKDLLGHTETLYTPTKDGWTISVRHYSPAKPQPGRTPVVLCHGLSYNGLFWDLAPDVSFAQYLADQGYDVWVPSLRGAGQSSKPPYMRLRQLFRMNLYGSTGGAIEGGGAGLTKYNWTVDDHALYDVPAILDLVTRRTGSPSVHWVGHSMGGMVMVAHLAHQSDGRDPRVRSFVAVGVPVAILKPASEPLRVMAERRGAIGVSNALVSTSLPALLGIVGGGKLKTPIDTLFYNSANINPNVVRLLNSFGTEDISPGQFEQLMDMVSGGHFQSVDNSFDYFKALPRMKVPALWLAGSVDNLATARAVELAYNQYGSAEKQYHLFGRANGQSVDYGHDDLILSPKAPQDVWLPIFDWLDQHDLPLVAGVPMREESTE